MASIRPAPTVRRRRSSQSPGGIVFFCGALEAASLPPRDCRRLAVVGGTRASRPLRVAARAVVRSEQRPPPEFPRRRYWLTAGHVRTRRRTTGTAAARPWPQPRRCPHEACISFRYGELLPALSLLVHVRLSFYSHAGASVRYICVCVNATTMLKIWAVRASLVRCAGQQGQQEDDSKQNQR